MATANAASWQHYVVAALELTLQSLDENELQLRVERMSARRISNAELEVTRWGQTIRHVLQVVRSLVPWLTPERLEAVFIQHKVDWPALYNTLTEEQRTRVQVVWQMLARAVNRAVRVARRKLWLAPAASVPITRENVRTDVHGV